MKLRVNWKLEGSYTLNSSDIDEFEGDDASVLEQATEVIKEDPFADVDPIADGKETVEVVKVD